MDWGDAGRIVHFRELHFLPRVIFSIGTILLIGSFFVRLAILGFVGIVVLLAASALNLVINTSLGIGAWCKEKPAGFPHALFWQMLLAIVLTLAMLYLTYYSYRHGAMPMCLQPLPL
jgi:hypothetical protein